MQPESIELTEMMQYFKCKGVKYIDGFLPCNMSVAMYEVA